MLENVQIVFFRCIKLLILILTISCGTDEIYNQKLVVQNTVINIELKVSDMKAVGKDIPKKREIKLNKAGYANTIKLQDSPQGETEIRIYYLEAAQDFSKRNESDLLIIEDGWMIGVIEYETLELVEMNHGEEYLKSKILNLSERRCIGKFFRSKFIEDNCEIESY